jgi:hypothetical protein
MASAFASCSFLAKPGCELRLGEEQHTSAFRPVRRAHDCVQPLKWMRLTDVVLHATIR